LSPTTPPVGEIGLDVGPDDVLVGRSTSPSRGSRPWSCRSRSCSRRAGSRRRAAPSSPAGCRRPRTDPWRRICRPASGRRCRASSKISATSNRSNLMPPHARSPAGAARRWSSRRSPRRPRGVLQRLAGDDVARADASSISFHHLSRPDARRRRGFVGRRRAAGIGQRQADRLGDAGHGVGGELAAAGAAEGRRRCRARRRSSSLILPTECWPTASNTSCTVTSRPRKRPGRIEPP
jgi:hypothetical protein